MKLEPTPYIFKLQSELQDKNINITLYDLYLKCEGFSEDSLKKLQFLLINCKYSLNKSLENLFYLKPNDSHILLNSCLHTKCPPEEICESLIAFYTNNNQNKIADNVQKYIINIIVKQLGEKFDSKIIPVYLKIIGMTQSHTEAIAIIKELNNWQLALLTQITRTDDEFYYLWDLINKSDITDNHILALNFIVKYYNGDLQAASSDLIKLDQLNTVDLQILIEHELLPSELEAFKNGPDYEKYMLDIL